MKKLFLLLAVSLLLAACTPAATEDTSTPGASLLPQESSATSAEAGTSSDTQSEDAVSEEEHAILTPEEVLEAYEQAENGYLFLMINIPEERTVVVKLQRDGNLYFISTATSVADPEGGWIDTETEYYVRDEGDQAYLYTADDQGKWSVSETEFDEDALGLRGSLAPLFSSDSYEVDDTNHYPMKESFTVDVQNILYGKGYLDQGKGWYMIYSEDAAGDTGATLTLRIGDLNKTTVTLPEVTE